MESPMIPILFMVLVPAVVGENEDTEKGDSSPASQSQEEFKKGSPIGNAVLMVLVLLGLLGYMYIQWLEKRKTSKVNSFRVPRTQVFLRRSQ